MSVSSLVKGVLIPPTTNTLLSAPNPKHLMRQYVPNGGDPKELATDIYLASNIAATSGPT